MTFDIIFLLYTCAIMEGHSFSSIVGLFSSKSFQTSSAIGSEELPVPSDARRQITCCSNSTLLVVGKELRGNSKCWGKDWGGAPSAEVPSFSSLVQAEGEENTICPNEA